MKKKQRGRASKVLVKKQEMVKGEDL